MKIQNTNTNSKNRSDGSRKSKTSTGNKHRQQLTNRFTPLKGPFKKTTPLRDIKSNDVDKYVREKLSNCCIVMDFKDPRIYDTRDWKQKTLIELMEYLSMLHGPIPDFMYGDVVYMFGCNVIRTLEPFHPTISVGIEDEDDYQLLDCWPHLQYVYEIFLKLLEHPDFDPKKSKRFLDNSFLKLLLDLFDSPDPRERDYLKTILHRIYGKMIHMRSTIRKQINNIFFTFIYEVERHNGIAELLEILGSIINGFQVPIKDEHRNFLKHVLLPLHKPRCLGQYHPQLAYCVMEFIKKEKSLTHAIVVDGLIKFWPKMNSIKELMFLNELEECLELIETDQFKIILVPLFKQLARCVSSPNFQVCERTLYIWTNSDIVDLMAPNIRQILPVIFPALYNSKQHWNKSIHSMVFNALKIMMDMDQVAFDEFTDKFKEERSKSKDQIKEQTDFWKKVSMKARKNPLHSSYSESLSASSITKTDKVETTEKSFKNLSAEVNYF